MIDSNIEATAGFGMEQTVETELFHRGSGRLRFGLSGSKAETRFVALIRGRRSMKNPQNFHIPCCLPEERPYDSGCYTNRTMADFRAWSRNQ
jgi:hypothetical protein